MFTVSAPKAGGSRRPQRAGRRPCRAGRDFPGSRSCLVPGAGHPARPRSPCPSPVTHALQPCSARVCQLFSLPHSFFLCWSRMIFHFVTLFSLLISSLCASQSLSLRPTAWRPPCPTAVAAGPCEPVPRSCDAIASFCWRSLSLFRRLLPRRFAPCPPPLISVFSVSATRVLPSCSPHPESLPRRLPATRSLRRMAGGKIQQVRALPLLHVV